MMPASAASTAPRSEVSSQGCTTMVVAGGTVLRARDQALVLAVGRMRHRAERNRRTDAAVFLDPHGRSRRDDDCGYDALLCTVGLRRR